MFLDLVKQLTGSQLTADAWVGAAPGGQAGCGGGGVGVGAPAGKGQGTPRGAALLAGLAAGRSACATSAASHAALRPSPGMVAVGGWCSARSRSHAPTLPRSQPPRSQAPTLPRPCGCQVSSLKRPLEELLVKEKAEYEAAISAGPKWVAACGPTRRLVLCWLAPCWLPVHCCLPPCWGHMWRPRLVAPLPGQRGMRGWDMDSTCPARLQVQAWRGDRHWHARAAGARG
jgi:hypothetical protein